LYILFQSGVRAAEQVAGGLPPEQRAPPPAPVFGPVVDHVASLAESREVVPGVVGCVVVVVRCRQDHPRGPHGTEHVVPAVGEARTKPSSVAPHARLSAPPAAITEMPDGFAPADANSCIAPASVAEANHS